MKRVIYICSFVWMMLLSSFQSSQVIAVDAPKSRLDSLTACPLTQVSFPITVFNFNAIGAITLSIQYDSIIIALDTITSFVNPLFPGAIINSVPVGGGTTLKKIIIVWSSLFPVTLQDGGNLATLYFNYLGGSTDLVFDNSSNGGSLCEYADSTSDPLTDIPSENFYHNGFISPVMPFSVSISTPEDTVCQGTTVTYTASATNIVGNPTYTWYVNGNLITTTLSCETLTNGLVACYPFNGNANDHSGNGNNGTINGATLAQDRFGNPNSAFAFDGVNDEIVVPDSPTLNPSAISISCWLKPDTLYCFNTFLAKGGNAQNYGCTPQYEIYYCNLFHYLSSDSYNSNYQFTSANPLNTSTWQHIVLTHTGTTIKYYKNGILDTQTTSGPILASPSSQNLYIGTERSHRPYDVFFKGELDDISIYNRILSDAEIMGLFSAGDSTFTYTPNNGDTVYCVLTSSYPCVPADTSNIITMTVNAQQPVSVSISASANPFYEGTSVTFTAIPVNGGATPVYQWKVNGVNVGTNSPVYSYYPQNGDSVSCSLVSNLYCASNSPAISETIVMIILPACPGIPSVDYGGQTYHTVQIGTQCWLKENLNIGIKVNGSTDQTNNGSIEKYCYNDLESNCDVYGGLYQWGESIQYLNGASNTTSWNPVPAGKVQGICPDGWYVPSDADWCTLTTFLDPTVNCNVTGWSGTNAGGKMKEAGYTHWASPNAGATNTSEFTALGAGYRTYLASFNDFPTSGNFWSSSEYSTVYAIERYLNFLYAQVGRDYNTSKAYGFSVRCLKDTCSNGPNAPSSGTHVPSPTQIIWNWSTVAEATGYKWNTTNDYASATDMGTSITFNETGLTCNTAYIRFVWAYNVCGHSVSTTLNQTTSQNPSAEVSITASLNPACQGDTVTFTAFATNGGNAPFYQWFVNGSLVGSSLNCNDDSLIACYPFSGNANDESGNGNNGIVSGSILTSDRYGAPMKAYDFDGIDDQIVIPNSSSLVLGSNNFTITSWIYPTACNGSGGLNAIITKHTADEGSWLFRVVNNGSTGNVPKLNFETDYPITRYYANSEVTLNNWHFAVVRRIGNNYKFFLDGNPDGMFNDNKNFTTQYNVTISGQGNTSSERFTGKLDDIRIYKRALSDAEIHALFLNTDSTFKYVPTNGDSVFCVLTSSENVCNNPDTSNVIVMTVNPLLSVSVTIVASDDTICTGTSVTFIATPVYGGTSPSYQWKVNGMNAGTNSPIYIYTPVNGDQVTCILTSNAACINGSPATSNPVTVVVNPKPGTSLIYHD